MTYKRPLMSYALRHDKPRSWPPPPGIEFGDRVYSRPPPLDKLLTASPHFAAGKPLKPVSPVDAVSTPSYAGLCGYPMWFGPALSGAFSNYGLMRVLSLKCKTIGLALPARDKDGNVVLRTIAPPAFGEEQFWADE